jgi:RNA polymerase sigma-70 factor (ECF subfamily)
MRRKMSLENAKDQHHCVFAILLDAIQSGAIEDPQTFPSYAVMVAKRQAQQYLQNLSNKPADYDRRLLDDSCSYAKVNSEVMLENAERNALMHQTIAMLKVQEREILDRIYVQEQSSEEICKDMALTETQFRVLKSRAKGRFRRIWPKTVAPVKAQNPVAASHRLAKTSAA